MGRRTAAIVALAAAVAATSALAASDPRPLYTAGATEACLERLPYAIVGLPPATPPVPPALFVYRFPRERVPLSAKGQLGTWHGQRGIILTFFKTEQEARTSQSLLWLSLYGGRVIRNVAVAWAQNSVPTKTVQETVLRCLRGGTGAPAPRRAAPHASLATFVGGWGGHTRRLSVAANGVATEYDNDGCCHFVIKVSFRILRAKGTLTDATATFRVTSVKRGEWRSKGQPRVGQVGELVLKDGVVTDTLTGIYYCSDPAWGATGVCGA
jgi:hypothetical protein